MKKTGNLTQLILLLVSTLTIMSSATIAPALPQISQFFSRAPNAELLSRLILTLPALLIAVSAPVCGLVIDLLGRKKLLLAALVLYGLAGTAGFVLNNLVAILVSRALLGLAIAGIMTTATTLVGDYFTGDERRHFVGLQAGFMAVGGVLFVGLGGWIADFNWRNPFLIHLFALGLLPLAGLALAEPEMHKIRSQASQNPGQYSRFWLAFLVGFAFVSMILFYMMPVQVPFLLRDIGVFKSALAGLAIVCFSVTGTTVSFLYPKIKRKFNFLTIYCFTFLFMSVGYLIIGSAAAFWQVALGMFIAGWGTGLIIPNQNLWVITLAPEHLRGRLVGIVSTAFFLGQFLSPVLIQPLLRFGSLHQVFQLSAGFMLLAAFGLLVLNFKVGRKIY